MYVEYKYHKTKPFCTFKLAKEETKEESYTSIRREGEKRE